jgi:thiol-disulfide isomerase/thioredoxin
MLPATSFAIIVNDVAPTFFLRDSSGNNFYLSDYVHGRKQENVKGIIVSFFASWCKPCRNELPVLNSLVDELKSKGIKVVIIGYNEDFDKIEPMLADIKVTKPVVLSDRYGKVSVKYGVRSLPVTFFIGKDGLVKDMIMGEAANIESELRKKVDRLIHIEEIVGGIR